jgi:prephenate dehydrogenase
MNVGIVGLGLIGGSLARAISALTPHTVLGRDLSPQVFAKAKLLDAVELELTDERLGACETVILALYPADTVSFVREHAAAFKPGAVVIDTCGVKRFVCDALFPVAEAHGFRFIGAHPMAGLERAGFDHSSKTLFQGASMVLVPPRNTPLGLLSEIKQFFGALGFAQFAVATPAEHDRIIAYTSQLPHVVSSAFIGSPTATDHTGFSAGSYKDMTRVARLNEKMWTELFLENRENLLSEVRTLQTNLARFAEALAADDAAALEALLREGRERKIAADRADLRE